MVAVETTFNRSWTADHDGVTSAVSGVATNVNAIEISFESFLAAMSILAVIIIIGSFGNAVVLYVYARKNDKLTATLFILSLSIVDFVTCFLIIPMTVAMEIIKFQTDSIFFCKVYYILNTSGIPFSSLLMSAIALDRYFCICHPFLHVMTLRRAKIIVCLLASISLLMGVLVGFLCIRVAPVDELKRSAKAMIAMHASNQSESQPMDAVTAIVGGSDGRSSKHYECIETDSYNRQGGYTPQWEQILYNVIQKVHITFFILCIVLVILLYILIYRSVLAMRNKRRLLKGKKVPLSKFQTSQPTAPLLSTTEFVPKKASITISDCPKESPLLTSASEEHHADAKPNGGPAKENNEPVSILPIDPPEETAITDKKPCGRTFFSKKNSKKSVKTRDKQSLQNLKTAAMLFVVAIVFILTFVPAGLMANGFAKFNIVIFYMYYTNNAANPIIYCFMNKNFRDDLRKIFGNRNRSSVSQRH